MRFEKSGQFLATVSAITLIIATRSVSLAADIPEAITVPGAADVADIWVAVEGRWNIFETETFGSAFYPAWRADPDNGWGGGIEVGGRPAGSDLDFVLRAVYNQAKDEPGGLVYGEASYVNDTEVREQHIVVDFEVGRQVNIGMGGQTRVHGGLRFAHFDGEMVGTYYYLYDFGYIQKTTVIGPRIGIDQGIPIGKKFSLDLSAAGAVLLGINRQRVFCTGTLGPCSANIANSSSTVWNAEGSASLNYQLGNGEIEFGVRVDAFWDVFGSKAVAMGDKDQITWGPYARLVYYLSGGPD